MGEIAKSAKIAFTFETVKQQHYPEWGFRPNTPFYPLDMNFVFLNGGMGDYICWMQAIRWLAAEATWITGTLICPVYFKELADYWLTPFPAWKHLDYVEVQGLPKIDDKPFRGPMMLQQESLNATGAHLLTCGWVYFTNKEHAPAGWDEYPHFHQTDLDARTPLPEMEGLEPGSYAVLTTGVTTNSRFVPGHYWNPVIDHLIARGLKIVFLGKENVTTGNVRNIQTNFSKDIRYDLGVDLRNKTSLMDAAAIMSRAAVVVGHDNGLLHLAGCTDVPIVFGYNLASPEHRQPRRAVGKVYNVHLAHADLACNFCQSKTNFVIGYNFRDCFYRDNKCIDLMFADGATRWKTKIDAALAGIEGDQPCP